MTSPGGGPTPQRVVPTGRRWGPLLAIGAFIALVGTGILGRSVSVEPSTSAPPSNLPATSADRASPQTADGPTSTPNGDVVGCANPYTTPGRITTVVRPKAASWTTTGNLLRPRSGHTATLLPCGQVLVAGGVFGDQAMAEAELYDPSSGRWTVTRSMVAPRAFATATPLWNGKVLVAGGGTPGAPSAELYDPTTGRWTAAGNMVTSRAHHTATLLPDGKVLVAGGVDTATPVPTGGSPEIVASAEVYDPDSGTWTATGSLATPRSAHTATLLPDGRVLAAGGHANRDDPAGQRSTPILDTSELYDPDTGTWAASMGMSFALADHAAALLADGNVFVRSEADAQLYDSGAGSWTAVEPSDKGGLGTLTRLPDGTVLVTFEPRDAELYQPATGSWATTATGLNDVGLGTTATLLDDGTVLVAGGETAHGDPASAELYQPGNPLIRPLPASGALAPGTYYRSCSAGCGYQGIFLTLPPGWTINNGRVAKHIGQTNEVALSIWAVGQVYADPCHWQASAVGPLDLTLRDRPAIGPSPIPEYEGGLAHQADRTASRLTSVMLGGTQALRIELSVPAGLDLATCDRGAFRSWTEWGGGDGANSHNAPGQADVVYQVDVDRGPLVIDASHMPATSAADLAELETILRSMIVDW